MTSTLTRPTTPEAAVQPRSRGHLWRTGAVAGVAASVATAAFAAGAEAIDVPLTVGGESIPVLGFAQMTLFASILGTILAVVLSRRAHRPRHTFVVTTLVLTFLSFVPEALADAQASTKVALVLSHIVAATIVIPALARRLAD